MTMNRPALAAAIVIIGGSALAQGKVMTLDSIDPSASRDNADLSPLLTVVPKYPRQAWLDQIEGDVQVCFFVTRGGRPYNVAVRHSDNKLFERPAREAVAKSSFEAIPRPQKVPHIKTCRTFQFRLEPLEDDESTDQSDDVT
jgi:TonB family protein